MEKKSLDSFYIGIVKRAYFNANEKCRGLFIGYNITTDIASVVEEKAKEVCKDLNQLDIKEFKDFIKTPQIDSILVDCLESAIYSEVIDSSKRDLKIIDNTVNYCLKVVMEYYSKLAEDTSIIIVKNFIEAVLQSRNLLNPTIFLKEDFEQEMSEEEYRTYLNDRLNCSDPSKKNLYRESIQRVECELEIDFVPRNQEYEKQKVTYQRALKSVFQMGFIYLAGEYRFNDFYIPPILNSGDDHYIKYWIKYIVSQPKTIYESIRDNWRNIFNENDTVYIIGGPGYGKSLFLRNLINNLTKLNIKNAEDHLLLYCDLKTYYSGGDSGKTIIRFLQESMISLTGVDISEEFVKYYLTRGQCVILLDALDEVPKEGREILHKKLVAFFSTCNPNNKICITSRDRGFIPQENIAIYHIGPLTHYDIEEYLDKLINLRKFKKEDKKTFLEQAQALIDKDFLNNFLILSLMVNIYKAEKELPQNKIDLYKKCFDYIAKKREEEKSKTGYDWGLIYPLMKDSTFIGLSTLAAPNNADINREEIEKFLLVEYKTKYKDEATTEQAIKELLDFCSNRTELFVPSTVDDRFKFFHRSFFEYFYSRYIYQKASVQEMYDLMTAFDVDSEVFELTVALVKEENEKKYQELLDYIFENVKRDFESKQNNFIAFGILTSAMQVIDDAYYINEYLRYILNYPELMEDKKVVSMNQRFLTMWAIRGIGNDLEEKENFRAVYENKVIKYVLESFSELKRKDRREGRFIFDFMEKSGDEGTVIFERNIRIGIKNRPFFLSVYREYYDISDYLDHFDDKQFNEWLNAQSNLSRSDKNKLKQGIAVYRTIDPQKKEHFLKYLLD